VQAPIEVLTNLNFSSFYKILSVLTSVPRSVQGSRNRDVTSQALAEIFRTAVSQAWQPFSALFITFFLVERFTNDEYISMLSIDLSLESLMADHFWFCLLRQGWCSYDVWCGAGRGGGHARHISEYEAQKDPVHIHSQHFICNFKLFFGWHPAIRTWQSFVKPVALFHP